MVKLKPLDDCRCWYLNTPGLTQFSDLEYNWNYSKHSRIQVCWLLWLYSKSQNQTVGVPKFVLPFWYYVGYSQFFPYKFFKCFDFFKSFLGFNWACTQSIVQLGRTDIFTILNLSNHKQRMSPNLFDCFIRRIIIKSSLCFISVLWLFMYKILDIFC